MSTADAVDREVAWLTSFGDGLPNLVAPTGPWSVIQAWQPRVAAKKKTSIFVLKMDTRIKRFANIRSMPTYDFELRLQWPLSSGVGSAESDLEAFDAAIDLLLQRIMGPVQDKSHGGRFLSVGENPAWIDAKIDDPDTTVASMAGFTGRVVYSADDFEIIN